MYCISNLGHGFEVQNCIDCLSIENSGDQFRGISLVVFHTRSNCVAIATGAQVCYQQNASGRQQILDGCASLGTRLGSGFTVDKRDVILTTNPFPDYASGDLALDHSASAMQLMDFIGRHPNPYFSVAGGDAFAKSFRDAGPLQYLRAFRR